MIKKKVVPWASVSFVILNCFLYCSLADCNKLTWWYSQDVVSSSFLRWNHSANGLLMPERYQLPRCVATLKPWERVKAHSFFAHDSQTMTWCKINQKITHEMKTSASPRYEIRRHPKCMHHIEKVKKKRPLNPLSFSHANPFFPVPVKLGAQGGFGVQTH